jgi:protein-S-isoprenylcysteine O-methyltransferase Ste14
MASQRRNALVSVLFAVFGGPGLILVYLPLLITRMWITGFKLPADEALWEKILAGALIAAGLAPLLESIVRFVRVGRGTLVPTAPTERLVVSGLYRLVRNPMYCGVLTALLGEIALFRSRALAEYGAVVWLGMHLFVRFYEEPTLEKRHPGEFAAYRRNVPRWLPRLTPWKGD